MGNRCDRGASVVAGSEGRCRPRPLAAVVIALGVMIAACGDDADSELSARAGTSISPDVSSEADANVADTEMVMIEIAREFSAAADASDFDGAREFVSDDFTVDCRGEQRRLIEPLSPPERNFIDRPASDLDLCWPVLGDAGEFTVAHGDDGDTLVSWSKVRSQGLLVETITIEASIADDVISSLDIAHTVEELDDRDSSLPIAGWQSTLDVGQTYRHNIDLHCGLDRMEFNGKLFQLDEALEGYTATGQFQPPLHWPIDEREMGRVLLGLVTLVDENTIELSIPPDEVIAIFRVGETDEPECA
jgi:hypothetical protein